MYASETTTEDITKNVFRSLDILTSDQTSNANLGKYMRYNKAPRTTDRGERNEDVIVDVWNDTHAGHATTTP